MIIAIEIDAEKDRIWGTKFTPTFEAYICPDNDHEPCGNCNITTIPDYEYNLVTGDSPIISKET